MSSPSGVLAGMRWASAFSSQADAHTAADAVVAALSTALGDAPVDLAIVFLGAHHLGQAAAIAQRLRERLAPGCLIGASAHGVIASEHEFETGPGLTVIAARLPGVGL